jgi:hypothetical protein
MRCQVTDGELFEHAHYLQRRQPVSQSGLSRVDADALQERRPRAPPNSYGRLQQIKTVYDPGQVIVSTPGLAQSGLDLRVRAAGS